MIVRLGIVFVLAVPGFSAAGPPELAARFDAELEKIGQITPGQFAERYPTPEYLPGISWDPTTAKFFDQITVEKVIKPSLRITADGRAVRRPTAELPGYRLNPQELAAFKKNGFVVSERLGGKTFGQLYYEIYSRDLPVFITSDSVLHAWHRSYDAMLVELESTYLKASLAELLAGMHDALPAARQRYGGGVLKESVRDADYFLAVARSLLNQVRVSRKIDPPFSPGLNRLPPLGETPPLPVPFPAPDRLVTVAVPSKFGQDERVQKTLDAINRGGMQEFELFGRDREMDFSQFKPRGHYAGVPELHPYFRAMMWCGRIDLRIAGGQDNTGTLSTPRELGAAMVLLDLVKASGQVERWRQFDRVIQTFVGVTDSATFDDLEAVAKAADIDSPAALKTEADLEKLAETILDSEGGKQAIRGAIYESPTGSLRVNLPRSFTLLGQKFAVDSWVTSKVVYDEILWDGRKVRRRVPSGLDVAFAALGNDHLVPDLVGRIAGGSHPFRDGLPYQHHLAAARNVIDGSDPAEWDATIYTSWLKTLRTLTEPADPRSPEAMRTRAWAMKQTNTQLASWTQLRHDTVLYVKQSYTVVPGCYYPDGFVEPVVPFWERMHATASRSADLLEKTPFPEELRPTQQKQVEFLRHFAAQMTRLKAVAEKQLAQKELSDEDRKVLEDVMQIGHQKFGSGSKPKYTGWYPSLFYDGPEDCAKRDALVADVHTDPPAPEHGDPGCVLHQGVGDVDLMVIAVENGKDRVAYVGPTLSHYEFETPNAVRKTDAEWEARLDAGEAPRRPDWTRDYLITGGETPIGK